MDDITKQRNKKIRQRMLESLRQDQHVTIHGPYLILYDEKDGITVLFACEDGVVKLLDHKPPG